MLAAAAGAGSAAAGLITGALLGGTVIAEAAAAFAIRRLGYRVVLAAGALLLGAPTLALLPREPLAIMVAVSLVRGLGFGLCGVAAGGADRAAAPARTPRRGPGPARHRLRRPRDRRAAGRRLAGRPPPGDGGRGRRRDRRADAAGGPALAARRHARLAAGRRSGGGRSRRAPAGAGLRRLHGRGRRGRLVPPARPGGAERHRLGRPAGPGDHRHDQPLAGRPPRRPLRPRPAAHPGRRRVRGSAWPR